jgi:hypothetical protein
LVLQRHRQTSGVGPGRTTGVGQQQEREQPMRLGVPREQLDDQAAKPDGAVLSLWAG